MNREEADKILEDHYITCDTSECELCGTHTIIDCSCGYYDKYAHPTGMVSHVLNVLFPKESDG